VLASQSPRRRELLTTAGFAFSVRPSAVDEVRAPAEVPEAYALRLARAKAEAAWQAGSPQAVPVAGQGSGEGSGGGTRGREEIVLGADTIVVLRDPGADTVLEKPRDAEDARAMLRQLSGREHIVITGICLRHAGGSETAIESTRVRFAQLSAEEIDAYVATGEPMDKAGAYAIQGLASKFVESIEGCFFNVVGLPLALVYRKLQAIPTESRPV
jgi:septum formation protein